jgi:hypothetical protein
MDDNKIIDFPITTPQQYKAYLKADETTMMKIAGKLGYISGTIYAFFDCLKIETKVSARHFIKHKKRKNFHVVDEYYGRNTSLIKHIINRVRICSLEKTTGQGPCKNIK